MAAQPCVAGHRASASPAAPHGRACHRPGTALLHGLHCMMVRPGMPRDSCEAFGCIRVRQQSKDRQALGVLHRWPVRTWDVHSSKDEGDRDGGCYSFWQGPAVDELVLACPRHHANSKVLQARCWCRPVVLLRFSAVLHDDEAYSGRHANERLASTRTKQAQRAWADNVSLPWSALQRWQAAAAAGAQPPCAGTGFRRARA